MPRPVQRILDLPPAEVRSQEEQERRIDRARREQQHRLGERPYFLPGAEIERNIEERPHIHSQEQGTTGSAPTEANSRPRAHRDLATNDGDISSSRAMSSNQRDLQRRFSREPATRHSDTVPSFAALANAASLPPLRSLGVRRGPAVPAPSAPNGRPILQRPPERILDHYRPSEMRTAANPTSVEDLEYDLDDANSQLRALLEHTNTTMMSSPLSPSSTSQVNAGQADDSYRVKRRKLDSERTWPSFKGFRYGKYGQVKPGQLKMEIESCDGGTFYDEGNNSPGNIMRRDDSVYCTKRSRCNILLRHQGYTVFALTELVIRAPGHHFSSPVREGMVFVSMASDEVLDRTAQYQIQYVSRVDQKTPAERRNRSSVLAISYNGDGTSSSSTSRVRHRRIRLASHLDEVSEHKTAVFPVGRLPFPVKVVTDCSDTEQSPPPRRVLGAQPPNRIGPLPFENEDSEDGENAFSVWNEEIHFDDDDTPPPTYRRAQDMTLAEAADASQLAIQEAVRAVGGELLAPHAKFSIEKGKNRCTIKFNPPVSGRYILLKMYHPSANIDIQGVFAMGFAGPRYFPSVDIR